MYFGAIGINVDEIFGLFLLF